MFLSDFEDVAMFAKSEESQVVRRADQIEWFGQGQALFAEKGAVGHCFVC